MSASGFALDTATPGTLGVSGELGFDNAAAAWQAIGAALANARVTRLDLAGLHRSDSAGLACVLALVAAAERGGQPLAVEHLPSGMRALAQVCEVDELLA